MRRSPDKDTKKRNAKNTRNTRNALFFKILERQVVALVKKSSSPLHFLSPPKNKTQKQKTKGRPSCGFVLLLTASR